MQSPESVEAILRDTDPVTLAYRGLWELLESDAGWAAVVKPGCRIKFDGDNRCPMKKEVTTEDFPEVRIIASTSTPHPHATSSAHSLDVRFEIQVSTGDQRLTRYLFPLTMFTFRALSDVTEFLRKSIVWHGLHVVSNASLVPVTFGVDKADLNRGIVGWSAIWAVEVKFWFPKAAI
jgi:hypothetical protein